MKNNNVKYLYVQKNVVTVYRVRKGRMRERTNVII
jgi:hypothetical protein